MSFDARDDGPDLTSRVGAAYQPFTREAVATRSSEASKIARKWKGGVEIVAHDSYWTYFTLADPRPIGTDILLPYLDWGPGNWELKGLIVPADGTRPRVVTTEQAIAAAVAAGMPLDATEADED